MINKRCACGFLLLSFFLGGTIALYAEVNLKPVIDRLSSEETQDRIAALRDISRLKPPAATIRPHLEKMLADNDPLVRADLVVAIQEVLGEKGIDLLEKLYADEDRLVRDETIKVACRMWDKPRPRELCKAAFEDPDFGARIEVISTLKEYFPSDNQAKEVFRRGLKDPSEQVQRAAVFGTQAARDPLAVADLIQIAKTSGDNAAEPAAAEALGTIGTPEAVKGLISLLPKPQPLPGKKARPSDLVRAGAARSLARIKNPDSLPALRTAAEDPVLIVRIGAIEGLTEMVDKKSTPLFVKLLQDPEERMRRLALRALRRVADPTVGDAVRKVLRDDKVPTVRSMAASTLADLLKDKAIPDLAALKNDLDSSVRLEAAGALGGIGKAAASALTEFLNDSDYGVRGLTVDNLAQIGSAAQIPALVKAAEDTSKKNRQVRLAVAGALGRIKSPDGLPTLMKLAKDQDPSIRAQAAQALGQIGGPKAKETLDVLLKDEAPQVRVAARKAVEALGGGQKPKP